MRKREVECVIARSNAQTQGRMCKRKVNCENRSRSPTSSNGFCFVRECAATVLDDADFGIDAGGVVDPVFAFFRGFLSSATSTTFVAVLSPLFTCSPHHRKLFSSTKSSSSLKGFRVMFADVRMCPSARACTSVCAELVQARACTRGCEDHNGVEVQGCRWELKGRVADGS
jgi:hypothetical protein